MVRMAVAIMVAVAFDDGNDGDGGNAHGGARWQWTLEAAIAMMRARE